MAVAVQLFAGGSLVSLLTGIPLIPVMIILSLITLSYTLFSGFSASVTTDFIQLAFIFIAGIILIPLVLIKVGGFSVMNFLGIENISSILDPGVAFSFGIVTAIGLIAGAIADQQYWQRSFAIKKEDLRKAFIFGGILFALVPISLSLLGFLSANASLGIVLSEGVDVSMIGVQAVAIILPSWAVVLFVVMLLSGLASTLDSGLSATSSLWVTDVVQNRTEKSTIKSARLSMVGITIIGFIIALLTYYIPNFGLTQLWWIFNTIAACVMVPTILSLYWDRLTAKGVYWGVLISFIIGIPLFIYSNIINNSVWIVVSSLLVVGISTFFCVLFSSRR